MILERSLRQGVPFRGGQLSLKLLVPKLVLVFVQPRAQFAQFCTGEIPQLFSDFLNPAHPGFLPDINSPCIAMIFSCGD